MKITREIKTAILVLSSILIFIWGYSFLKGTDLLTSHKTFFVLYDDVEGLMPSAPVTINGLIVGKVKEVSFSDNTGKIKVELQISSDFPISKSSIARIYEPGLIGGKQIQIVPNFQDKNLAESNEYLTGGVKPGLTDLVTEKLTPLQDKIEKMMVNADLLLTNLNQVLDDKTKQNLKNSIANLDQTLKEFSESSKTINTLLAENKQKLNQTTSNLEVASSNFAKISDSIAKSNLKKTISNLETTLANVNQIMSDVQAGKGSMGKLVKDDALYNNFSKSSKELELLLQDLRLNPTRYVNVSLFGKKNKPYVAPKETDSTQTKK
ncbi:MlaD family protein [Flavobacterium sp.]|uniref:MlaD family protein n=1 Tax=Flavobacterium sp. TaxID=239 RepID=UPI002FDA35DB